MKRRLLYWLLIASIPMVVVGCDSQAAPSEGETELAPSPVDTLVLTPTQFVDTFEVLGTSEPIDSIDVSSDVPGKILEAYADAGDAVARGDRLFRIDTETDEAGQEVLETQVEAAERELARQERLAEEGLTTGQAVDNARTELAQARQNLRQSQVSIGRNIVTSPRTGHLATLIAEAGEFANAGAPLAEIIDYSTIVVHAQVPESEIRHVAIDEAGELDIDFPALDETITGQVDRVALRSSATTRTYAVEIEVDNAELRIRPGMRARVHFERRRYDDVLLIPRDAILEGYDSREVMVVAGDEEIGQARVRSIKTGPGTRDDIVVTQGLDVGDRLILRGHRGLIANAQVEVISEEHQGDDGGDR